MSASTHTLMSAPSLIPFVGHCGYVSFISKFAVYSAPNEIPPRTPTVFATPTPT